MPGRIYTKWAAEITKDIEAAEGCIYITALSMHPPKRGIESIHSQLLLAAIEAVKRGVTVNIALPASSAHHPATAQNASTMQILSMYGIKCHAIPPTNLLHAKTVMVDNEVLWIGSGNWTAAAAHHNHEMYARVVSRACAGEYRHSWDNLLKSIGGARAGSW